MKIELWHIGKTKSSWISTGEKEYSKKCGRFAKIHIEYLNATKGLTGTKIRISDSSHIIAKLDRAKPCFTVLLDERGKTFSSISFAQFIEDTTAAHGPNMRFITGGSHGVTDEVRQRCDLILSFSDFVFTHEMVRIILMEQIYRAFTILRRESYHHE